MANILSFEDTLTSLEEQFGDEPQQAPVRVDPESPREQAIVDQQSTILEVDPVEISNARVAGDLSHEDLLRQYPNSERYLERMFEAGVPVEEAAVFVSAYQERMSKTVGVREFFFNSMMMTDDEEIDPQGLGMLSNYEWLTNRIEERLEASDPSTFRWIAGGVDNFAQLPLIILRDIQRYDEAKSQEYAEALLLPPEAFKAYWEAELDSAEREGIFNIREFENLREVQRQVENFGTDPAAGFKQFMGWAEIATAGTTRGVARLGLATVKGAATGIPRGSRAILERLMSARSATDAVTATRGADAGADATVRQMNTGAAPDNTFYKGGPSTMDPFQGPTRPVNMPNSARTTQGTYSSTLFEKMATLMKSPVSGRAFSIEAIQEVAEGVVARVAKVANNPTAALYRTLDEGSDLFTVTVRLGNSIDGRAFPTREAALKSVNNNPDYKVVEAPRVIRTDTGEPVRKMSDVPDGVEAKVQPKGFYLEYSERLNTRRLADALEDVNPEENAFKRAIAGVISAPQTALGGRLGFLINAAEGVVTRFSKFADQSFKDVRSLSKGEFKEVEGIMTGYRDGILGDIDTGLAAVRGAPTQPEFIRDFFALYGKTPTEKQLKAYNALTDINNAAWNIKATDILKRVAERNGRTVRVWQEGSKGYDSIGVAIREQDIPENAVVFSRLTGSTLPSQLDNRVVYKLDEPFEAADGIKYDLVTDVVSTRVPLKTDVLGYNVGGPRNNDRLRQFIGTSYDETLAGGRKVTGGFRTLLGSFSMKEARTARNQLNNIVDSLAPFIASRGLKGIRKLDLSGEDLAKINGIIARNNSWNPNVVDFDTLKRIAADHNESFTNRFDIKARDAKVESAIPEGAGMNMGEYQAMRVTRRRGDTAPMTYGGGRTINQSPIENIVEQFKSEAYRYSHYKATQSAVNGWVTKARARGNVTFDGDVPHNPEDFIRLARVSDDNKGINREMKQQQQAIASRLGLLDRTDATTPYMTSLSEFIYDKTGAVTNPADWIGNAAGRARAMVFHMKMGLGNTDQFILNASHVAQITFISPKYGVQAAANVPIIASLLFKTRKAADADIERLVSETMREYGGLMMTKQELIDTVRYMKESGRSIIGSNTLERSGATFNSNKTGLSEALELGLTPFKGGELYGRIAAAAVAIMEHNATRVSGDVFSDKGIRYVANREQALTFRMTSGQRARFQGGTEGTVDPILALATQWQSYSLRFVDNLLIGRDLTGAERARMAAFNTLAFGLRGMGAPPRMMAGMTALGVDPEDPNAVETLNLVKFGLFDKALSELAGVDVSLGSRIGPLSGIFQQYYDSFGNDPLLATLTGPSGQILSDSLKAVRGLTGALFGGQSSIAYQEFVQLTRGIKSVDMFAKVSELIETGEYRSKRRGVSGEFAEEEITFGLIASIVAGATPMRVLNHYDAKDISYGDDRRFRTVSARIRRFGDQAIELIATGDEGKIAEGRALYEDALSMIKDGGFSYQNQQRLYRSIISFNSITDLLERTQGQSAAARITALAAQGE
jgi:hypothetical protein